MRLSKSEREHLGTVQRKCRRCKNWFYVEPTLTRSLRETGNAVAHRNGTGEYQKGPTVGRTCPDCKGTD